MMRVPMRILALLLIVPALSACAAGRGRPLEPLVAGSERFFTVEWELARRGDRPVVSGSLTNQAPYIVKSVQILVESLDASGGVVAQEVTEVASQMTPSTRSYFEVPAHAPPAAAYRVRVFAFDSAYGCGD